MRAFDLKTLSTFKLSLYNVHNCRPKLTELKQKIIFKNILLTKIAGYLSDIVLLMQLIGNLYTPVSRNVSYLATFVLK